MAPDEDRKLVYQRCKEAILAELRAVGAPPEIPIDLYRVGPSLIAAGFTQDEIVTCLDSLVSQKRIEYAGGNRVRLLA